MVNILGKQVTEDEFAVYTAISNSPYNIQITDEYLAEKTNLYLPIVENAILGLKTAKLIRGVSGSYDFY